MPEKNDSKLVARRKWLSGLAASAVIAFDPVRRSWVSTAHAHGSGHTAPEFDGELVVTPEALAEAADDFGHYIHRTPIAVLRPGSISDVRRLVQFAATHRIAVSMRGQGHSTHGQAQVEAGVVIDSRTLQAIEEVSAEGAVVQAGALWIDVLSAALEQGLTPPVLTDFIGLSVGGTLSVGGLGGATQHHGLQVDNVLELQVVTGTGELVTCSAASRRDLFEAVLGGLGQFGIIVRAKLKLIEAPTNARVYRLFYADLATFLQDQRIALSSGRFDYLEGQALPRAEGGFDFMLEAAAYYSPPALPDDTLLLDGLSHIPEATAIEEHSYFDWQNRLAPAVAFFESTGQWALPHPFVDLFLPDAEVEAYVADVLSELTPLDTGGGPILCYPFSTAKLTRPFVAMPDSDTVFLFDILRFAPADPAVVETLVQRNRALFEQARAVGGKKYPISSVPFDRRDWVEHFGSSFRAFAARKRRYDPRRILATGQGIFHGPRRGR